MPPPEAPAAALEAVVSVARARAWPVPDPTPEAWKIVPTVLAAAPMEVKVVEPTVVISYHWPETNDPALTIGLFAPPMSTFWSMVTVNPFAKTVSPLPGRTPPFHVEVALQLPDAIARRVAIIRFLSPK